MLQRPAYYQQFAEAFTDRADQMIPEDIMSDWIDRLTIRTFNEELKTAFPYIFRLVDESEIPVKRLNPEDLLQDSEIKTYGIQNDWHKRYQEHKKRHHDYFNSDTPDEESATKAGKLARHAAKQHELATGKKISGADEFDMYEERTEVKDKDGKVISWKDEGEWKKVHKDKDGRGKVTNMSDKARRETEKMSKELNPAESFESFMEKIIPEDIEAQTGKNNLFSPNLQVRGEAVKSLKQAMEAPLPAGESGLTAIQSLEGIIDSEALSAELQKLAGGGDDQIDSRGTIKTYLTDVANGKIQEPEAPDAQDVAKQLIAMDEISFSGGEEDEVGGQNMDQPPAGAEPLAPPPAAAPPAPPAPEGGALPGGEAPEGGMPPAPPEGGAPTGEAPPAPPPMAESVEKIKSKFKKAIECGAKGSTKMNFTGRGETTLLSAMESLGIDPSEMGIEVEQDPIDSILKSVIGFWNHEAKNFTIGGTKVKIKIFKDFKNGEYPGCQPQHVKHVIDMIEKMDPSSDIHGQEQSHVLRLAGVGHGHDHAIAEGPSEDFAKMMQDFSAKNPNFDVNAAVKQIQQKQPAAPQGMPQFNLDDPQGMENHFKNFFGQVAPQLGQKVQAATQGQPTQNINMPGFNGQFNPADLGNHIGNMMKGMNFNEAEELNKMLKIAGIRK